MRSFPGIDLERESEPDTTTELKFRDLLEGHGLTAAIFQTINVHLQKKGPLLHDDATIDAAIIEAPPSTTNRDKARNP